MLMTDFFHNLQYASIHPIMQPTSSKDMLNDMINENNQAYNHNPNPVV